MQRFFLTPPDLPCGQRKASGKRCTEGDPPQASHAAVAGLWDLQPLRVDPAHQTAGSLALHQLILLNEAVEHGGDLSAGRRALRVKQIAGFSLHKAAADRPLHRRLCVIRDLVRVLELVQISLDGQIVALVVCVAVEDGCKLFTGDGSSGPNLSLL